VNLYLQTVGAGFCKKRNTCNSKELNRALCSYSKCECEKGYKGDQCKLSLTTYSHISKFYKNALTAASKYCADESPLLLGDFISAANGVAKLLTEMNLANVKLSVKVVRKIVQKYSEGVSGTSNSVFA